MSASANPQSPGDLAAAPSIVVRRKRSLKASTHVWLRWLHTYTSMISLLVVLFFSLTGITLNHPDWLFGSVEQRREVTGTLPGGWISGGQVNWLSVAEELRARQNLKGRAEEGRVDGQEASISFLGPGYSADAVINTVSGQYTVNILEQGSVAVLNDLHKGRDSGTAWKWLIDLSGVFLTLVSLTGLGILLYLKKTRLPALISMSVASLLVLVLGKIAIH